MTKDRLKKLRALVKEAEHLQSQYIDAICFPKEQVVDSYKDYSTGFPHTKSISGYGDSAYVDVRQKLYEKQRQIQQEIAFLEDWLDSVEDPELRDILRLQYINGLTQEQIAVELGYSRSAIAMKLDRFWKNYC
ncbi:MAG: sigma factor-like helix-turn-helix DNA-binding protein [Anaerovoracaceae bacterium]